MNTLRFGYGPDDQGARFCRAVCRRLRAGMPDTPRPSAQAQALCLAFCKSFVRRQPMLAVRRPAQHRSEDRPRATGA